MSKTLKQFEALIYYRDDGKLSEKVHIISTTSLADAKKTAKRLAQEVDGRVVWVERKTE
jgi:hypothetical protein